MGERIQKILASAGHGSRRHCEKLIRAGRVKVNGRSVKLGDKADPHEDRIEVDGQAIFFEKPLYIMLNKPQGVLSSTEDEMGQGRRTVLDLVNVSGHLYPVGRLDKQSEGLILLTNDGHLAHRLTHPRFGHEKVYRVDVQGEISEAVLQRWRRGVGLDGRRTAPAEIELLASHGGHSTLLITLREGRKRQIRRIAASFGHPVIRLVRLRIGPTELGDLEPGQWRYLKDNEVRALRDSVDPKSRIHGGSD